MKKDLLNTKVNIEEWDNFSNAQKSRIDESIEQIKNGNFHKHEDVMKEIRNRISNSK
jgi:predicted transcriptional regulator